MQLQPRRPPGRRDRKAAAYVAEIVRLRADGYTYDAIREALADVGIELSTSALRREMLRHRKRSERTRSATAPRSRASEPVVPAAVATDSSPRLRGRDIAEAFFRDHQSNPLLRATKDVP